MTNHLDSYPVGDWKRLEHAGPAFAGSLVLPRVFGWTDWAKAQLADCPDDPRGQARAEQLEAALAIAEAVEGRRVEEGVGF